ncbi:MAG TPA: nuclear transport factor 2 family protein [Candidatus Acidoferrales bacterium]|nr:nuclear transport factor 2 family protein [Candidatus Acidoferrales bacterium]HXK01255.1 nuclear transport factor 2 family protein [Verrucomicrobiae bacterium]
MRILFILFLVVPAFAQMDNAIEKAVLAANDQVTRAAEARDLDRLFSFMVDTDKGSIIQNGVLSLTTRDARARVEPGFRQPLKVAYHWKQQHVTVLAPTAALLVSEGETAVTSANGDFTVPFVQTTVWVLRDGAWKILHAHQSSPPR